MAAMMLAGVSAHAEGFPLGDSLVSVPVARLGLEPRRRSYALAGRYLHIVGGVASG